MTPSITLTLMSELLGRLAAQEARPVVGEGQTPTPAPAALPAPASEPQGPKRWRTLRTPDGQRPSPRQAQRDARQYAEAWYRHIRDWYVCVDGEREIVKRRDGYSRGEGRMRPVVGNWASAPYFIQDTLVTTPIGPRCEANLAALCNADPLLSRIRDRQGPASLLRENGTFNHPVKRMRAYALAALRVGVALGDEHARSAYHTLKME